MELLMIRFRNRLLISLE